jgi:hypothetical protein
MSNVKKEIDFGFTKVFFLISLIISLRFSNETFCEIE